MGKAWRRALLLALSAVAAPGADPAGSGSAPLPFAPGGRVLLDAHNAYPYRGRWGDRIERALATGVPLAIEQDLAWTCQGHGPCRSVAAHEEPFTGDEPPLREHFFERIRPLVERALASGDRRQWPLVTLNLDFKTNEPEHHAAVWSLLGEYEPWLTTAPRTAAAGEIAPLTVGPVLVLTGTADAQEAAFHDRVPVGARLRVFGAVTAATPDREQTGAVTGALPADVSPGPRTNYRRWWNNAWSAVEAGGPREAGEWTLDDDRRLRTLVERAHAAGLWIRFYTLDGVAPGEPSPGWHESYNFGSLDAARLRWRAAIDAGVDFVATDQYEAFAAVRAELAWRRPSAFAPLRRTRRCQAEAVRPARGRLAPRRTRCHCGEVRRIAMQLQLSAEETTLLRDLLADYLPALRREVARTERHDLRHLLVQRLDLVERLVEQLAPQSV